jgi:hypothetical protein
VEIRRQRTYAEIFPGLGEIEAEARAHLKSETKIEEHQEAIEDGFVTKVEMVGPNEFRFGGAIGDQIPDSEKPIFGAGFGNCQEADQRAEAEDEAVSNAITEE